MPLGLRSKTGTLVDEANSSLTASSMKLSFQLYLSCCKCEMLQSMICGRNQLARHLAFLSVHMMVLLCKRRDKLDLQHLYPFDWRHERVKTHV